jgi:TonB family protein
MKKNLVILGCLLVMSGLLLSAQAQTKRIPPPDKDIPHDKEPVLVKQVQPVYPASMLSGGWEAVVYLRAFIDVDGNVVESRSEKIQINVTKTSSKTDESVEQKGQGKAFEEAAYTAVKQWKFSPAQLQGKPVAAWITIPFRFKMNSEEAKPEEAANRAEMEKGIESIKTVIENILKGSGIENAKKYVGKGALLIYNTKSVNLLSVLNGEQKGVSLTEGKNQQNVNFNINLTDDRNAVVVLTVDVSKSKNKRVHSILLSKGAAKEWKIIHWHVSF